MLIAFKIRVGTFKRATEMVALLFFKVVVVQCLIPIHQHYLINYHLMESSIDIIKEKITDAGTAISEIQNVNNIERIVSRSPEL